MNEYTLNKIKEFREATGLPINSGEKCDYKTHIAVTLEEVIEAADGLTDSLVTIGGIALDAPEAQSINAQSAMMRIGHAMTHIGFRPRACMDIVHSANMSKLCRGEELTGTIQKYAQIGVKTEYREVSDDLFAVYCTETVTAHDGKFYPAKKLLKCVNWHEPDWADLSQWMDSDLVELFECGGVE